MDTRTLVLIAVVVLACFGRSMAGAAKRAALAVRDRLPSLPPVSGLFTAKISFELWQVVLILVAFWFCLGGATWQGCKLPTNWELPTIIGPATPPLVVMMHEASHGPLSQDAIGAANELTAAGREVRMIDDDVTDGTGETPDWLKPGLSKGREIMGGTDGKAHALILLSGQSVVKAKKLPDAKAEIVRECQ